MIYYNTKILPGTVNGKYIYIYIYIYIHIYWLLTFVKSANVLFCLPDGVP